MKDGRQFKHSTPQHNMEVTAQPQDPTALILRKEPVCSIHPRHPPPHPATLYTWKDQIMNPWLSSTQPRDCYNWGSLMKQQFPLYTFKCLISRQQSKKLQRIRDVISQIANQWWCVVNTVVNLTPCFFTASTTVSGATGSTTAASFVASSTICQHKEIMSYMQIS